jgi:hypothetical protein
MPPVRLMSLGGLTGWFGNSHTNRWTPGPSRIKESWYFWSCKRFPCGTRAPHPINMKGNSRLRLSPNRSNTFFNFYPQTLGFPTLYFPYLSRRWSRTFWVACQPQSNTTRATSDGIPPEVAFVGFHQCLWVHRSDRFGQELSEFSVSTGARVCWPLKVSTQFGDSAGEERFGFKDRTV